MADDDDESSSDPGGTRADDQTAEAEPLPAPPPVARDPIAQRFQAQRLLNQMFGTDEPTCVGGYEIIDELGSGGMGVVYAAMDRQLGRRVAIKTLHDQHDDELRDRLIDEARAMARLDHPNVVTVFQVASLEWVIVIVMEYIDGRTLDAWLRESRRSNRDIIEVFLAAGEGLEAAHHVGLVHRDFKPTNVMIGPRDRVRVMDFGLACVDPGVAETEIYPNHRRSEVAIAGTPAFMPPEQFKGQWVDAKSDQFAFCVSLYQALYGEHPFGDSRAQIWPAAERGDVRKPRPGAGVPDWLRDIVVRGLAPNPNDRFESMRGLLLKLITGEPRRLHVTDERLVLQIVFSSDFEFDDFDDAERSRMQDLLRIVTRDPRLSLHSVTPGSIVVTIEVTKQGADRLDDLHVSGVLGARLGMAIHSITVVQRVQESTVAIGRNVEIERSERAPSPRAGSHLPMTASDQYLFKLWAAGDQQAGARFVERHFANIDRFFRFKVGEHSVDLTQATFLAAQEGSEHKQDDSSVRAWLFGIAYNKLLRHHALNQLVRGPAVSTVADLDPSPTMLIAAGPRHRLLLAALRRLPLDVQVMLELHYWEEMQVAEIAQVVKKPVNTVKTQMRGGHQRLEELMHDLAESQEELKTTLGGLEGWAERVRQACEEEHD